MDRASNIVVVVMISACGFTYLSGRVCGKSMDEAERMEGKRILKGLTYKDKKDIFIRKSIPILIQTLSTTFVHSVKLALLDVCKIETQLLALI